MLSFFSIFVGSFVWRIVIIDTYLQQGVMSRVQAECAKLSCTYIHVLFPGDIGDHVVVMNTRHIAFSGNKWEQKVYSSHTG